MTQAWITPQLVQLSRGNPEEAVLTTCKATTLDNGGTNGSSSQHNAACNQQLNPNCGTCSGQSNS